MAAKVSVVHKKSPLSFLDSSLKPVSVLCCLLFFIRFLGEIHHSPRHHVCFWMEKWGPKWVCSYLKGNVFRHCKAAGFSCTVHFIYVCQRLFGDYFLAHLSYAQGELLWSLECPSSVVRRASCVVCQQFQQSSSLKPLARFEWYLPGIVLRWPSCKFLKFMMISKKLWPPVGGANSLI